jgi:ADP-ribosylglycohydrolase
MMLSGMQFFWGDCDTRTCITGSIAEAFYGVPEELKQECLERLLTDLKVILLRFEEIVIKK